MARNKINSTTTTTYTDKQGNVQTRTTTTKTRSKTSSHGVSVGASTNVWGVVSLIFIIGLIATVFFAHYNSTRKDGVVQYFSPSKFLNNISYDVINLPEGDYILSFDPLVGGFFYTVYGWVEIGGMKFESSNFISVPFHVEIFNGYNVHLWDETLGYGDISFEIEIDGVLYYASYDSALENYVLKFPGTSIKLNEMPQIADLALTWGEVEGWNTFWTAVSDTGDFVRDMIRYNTNLLKQILPWNFVVDSESSDVPNLPQLWAEAESKNGRS